MANVKKIIVDLFTHNWSLKLVSLVVAIFVWLYVSIGQTVLEVPKRVSLELKNLPAELIRVSDVPAQIEVKISGSSAQLRSVSDERLVYELDLSGATPGMLSFKIISTRIKGIPGGVKLTEISPSEVSIKFSERVTKNVPVEIVTKGRPVKGWAVDDKNAEPPLVKVSGAREEIENLTSVTTEPIDLTGVNENYEGVHALDLSGRHIELINEKEVRVKIHVTKDLIQREFSDVAVSIEKTDLEWSVEPKKINLRLKGPTDSLRDLKPDMIRLVVDAEGLEAGIHVVRPQIIVPGEKDIVLVGLDLPEVRLTLGKAKQKKK